MHHGYYIPVDRTDHVQAQIDLIDEVLKWAEVDKATSAVDVGCGIGGSSRHIAKKFGCKTQGITLSPYQANRGNELAKEQSVSDLCNFQVRFVFWSTLSSGYVFEARCSSCSRRRLHFQSDLYLYLYL
jgi:tocopherol O-methyltransferase